ETGAADGFCTALGDLLAALDEDLARPFAANGVHDVANRNSAFNRGGAAATADFLLIGFIERAEDVGVEPVLGVHRAQQRDDGELAALVDADGDAVLFRGIDFDPASALGNDAATEQPAFARFHFGNEVDAGAAVQLADDDAFGAVDDEFAAA